MQRSGPRAIRNPGSYYFDAVEPSDWTTPKNEALWQNAVKTLFDPCPPGWRLPKSGNMEDSPDPSPWKAFSIENSIWDDSGGSTFHSVVYGASGSTWYPAAGYRRWTHGALILARVEAGSISSTQENGSIHYLFSVAQAVNPSGFSGGWPHPAIAFPARCVRE